MKETTNCILVKELQPLYQDDILSEECKQVVNEHLHDCTACKEYYITGQSDASTDLAIVSEKELNTVDDMDSKERDAFSKFAKKIKHKKWISIIIPSTCVLIVMLFFQICFQLFRVEGPSMEPTLYNNSLGLVCKTSYLFHSPGREDIIVCKIKQEHQGTFFDLARIVGLPGDKIKIEAGNLFVNGSKQTFYQGINTNTSPTTQAEESLELTVPENQYFILGDNFAVSYDSRYYGCVTSDSIYGKYLLTLPVPKMLSGTYTSTTTTTNTKDMSNE